jgi:hypothetical protein
VQGSGYNTCTGKYCIICPGGIKRKKKKKGTKCTQGQEKSPVSLWVFTTCPKNNV